MSGLTNNSQQKFELRGYSVFFDINDSLSAENLLDSLDRATPILKQVFEIDEPQGSFYLVKDYSEVQSVLGNTGKANDIIFYNILSNCICLRSDKIKTNSCGEIGVKALGLLIFNKAVNEREVRIKQWRTPSWLREGFAFQASYKIRQDHIEWLQSGWEKLQTAQKQGSLLKPNMLIRDLSTIIDPQKLELAKFQSYYMVKLLLSIYCDKFFSKYSTLMKAIDDMDSENCFRQITSFSYEKFFSMFENWVQKVNAWTAME